MRFVNFILFIINKSSFSNVHLAKLSVDRYNVLYWTAEILC